MDSLLGFDFYGAGDIGDDLNRTGIGVGDTPIQCTAARAAPAMHKDVMQLGPRLSVRTLAPDCRSGDTVRAFIEFLCDIQVCPLQPFPRIIGGRAVGMTLITLLR
jgi:hypothetical protein